MYDSGLCLDEEISDGVPPYLTEGKQVLGFSNGTIPTITVFV